jgi:hypothetical protein
MNYVKWMVIQFMTMIIGWIFYVSITPTAGNMYNPTPLNPAIVIPFTVFICLLFLLLGLWVYDGYMERKKIILHMILLTLLYMITSPAMFVIIYFAPFIKMVSETTGYDGAYLLLLNLAMSVLPTMFITVGYLVKRFILKKNFKKWRNENEKN